MNYAGKFGSGGLDSSTTAQLELDSLSHRGHGHTVTVPDAHLLFSGDFVRSGRDLIISDASHHFVVPNYFDVHKRPALVSPDGAPLDPRVVDALTGHTEYAQAGGAPAAKVVGHIVKMTGSASVVRNGVTVVLNNGDAIYQNDVVQTGSGSTLGLVLDDGTTFNLTANARLMLNDLTYDANSTSNSSLITLVQGAASFVAGQVAKTGDMKVATPVATMGIRGTAVTLDISSVDGKVSVSVMDQGDGQVHSVQVFDTRGNLIGTVTSSGAGLTLTPTATFEVIAQESNKTPAQVAQEFNAFQALLTTYDAGKQLFPNLPQHTEKGGGDNNNNNNNNTNPNTTTKYASSAPPSPAPDYHPPAGSPSVASTNTQTAQVVVTTSSSGGGSGGGTPTPPTTTTESTPVIKTVTFTPAPFVVTSPTVASITNDGGDHTGPVMSATGDLVYDPDGIIYFYDHESQTTIRVTPNDGHSYSGQTISSDGHYVVYQSDDGGQSHVYVWGADPSTGAHYHTQTLIGVGGAPAVSGDGHTILVELDGKIGIYDLDGHLRGTITASAVNATGLLWLPSVSADGHIIAFWSSDSGSPGGPGHLHVYDSTTGVYTSIADVTSGAGNHSASISADGHLIAYEGVSTAGRAEIYLYDLNTHQVVFSTEGVDITFTGDSRNPVISPDGHFIVFTSDAKFLAADGNTFADAYMVDVTNPAAPTFKLISEGSSAASGGGVAISAGGAYAAFASGNSGSSNIFVADPTSGRSAIIQETADSPQILSAAGSIILTGALDGVQISVSGNSGPTPLLTASLQGGTISWSFSQDTSDPNFVAPAYGQDLVKSFVITATSPSGDTTTIPVTITIHNSIQPTITAVDAPPVAVPITLAAGQEDTSYVIVPATLLAGVSDVDGPSLTITNVTVQSGGGAVSQNGSGHWVYTPPVNSTGQVVLNYTASDGTLSAQSTASLTLVGTGVNRAGDNGNNTLTGTPANDAFQGFGGDDTIIGLDGIDRAVYSDATGGITVDLAGGHVSGPGVGTDTLIGVEAIQGSNFVDSYSAAGFNGDSHVPGVPLGFNSFEGLGGDDSITGNINSQGQKLTRIVYNNATAAVTVDFALGKAHGTASGDLSGTGTDTFTNVNAVVGSAYGDTLLGSDNSNQTYEQYEARRGNDFIDGRGGYDFAVYNNDPDTTSGILVDMAAGTVVGDSSIGTDTLRNLEGVRGTNFDDVYHGENFGLAGFLNAASNNVGSIGTFNNFDGAGGDDTIFGNGNTRIQYSNATAGVTVDFVLGKAHGTAPGDLSGTGTDTFTGVNSVMGSTFADDLRGDGNGNTFHGLAGDDFIDGRGGFDTAVYNNATYTTGGISVDMGAGTVTGNSSVGLDTLRSIEGIQGTNFADTYDARTYMAPGHLNVALNNVGNFGTFNQFEGFAGNDTIFGNDNTTLIYQNATAGVTVIMAEGTVDGDSSVGHDTFSGVNGIVGSNSNDTFDATNPFAPFTFVTFQGLGGDDNIIGAPGTTISYSRSTGTVTFNLAAGTVDGNSSVGHDTFSNVSGFVGSNSADFYDARNYNPSSGYILNTFEGLGGDDQIFGNGSTQLTYVSATAGVTIDLALGRADGDASVGHDTFTGVGGIGGSNFGDHLFGDSASNGMFGGGGDDLLDGRGGSGDSLFGGSGADTFVYATGYGVANFMDVNLAGEEGDKIDLTGVANIHTLDDVLARTTFFGNQAVIDFGGGDSLNVLTRASGNFVASDFIFTPAPVNHAPTLNAAALTAVSEDAANPSGQQISAIFAGKFQDADAGSSFIGIGVTGATSSASGSWQYAYDGTHWSNFPSPLVTSAAALPADAWLRFVPAHDFSGTPPSLGLFAIDNTFGEALIDGGQPHLFDPASRGGSTPFSVNTTLAASVTPVADTPVVTFDTTAFGPAEQRVDQAPNTDLPTSMQIRQSVTALSDGGWVVVWTDSRDGGSYEIYQRHYDAAGNAGPDQRVDSAGALHDNATVTALPDGGWLVIYQDSRSGTSWDLYAHRYDAYGTPAGSDFQLVTAPVATQQVVPDVAVLSSGELIVTWLDNRGGANAVWQQRVSVDGVPDGVAARVDAAPAGSTASVQSVTALPDGGWLVVWADNRNDHAGESSTSDIFMRRYDSSGNPTTPDDVRVDGQPDGTHQSSPHVAVLADGGWVITWHNEIAGGSDIYQARFDANGAKIGSDASVDQSSFNNGEGIVTALPDGGWVVTWDEYRDGYVVFQRRYGADGAAGDSVVIDQGTENDSMPAVALTANGKLVVTWSSQNYPADYSDIYQRVVDLPGIGNENHAVTLPKIAAAVSDVDGSEVLSLSLSGFPPGATFSVGSLDADSGRWMIPAGQVASLATAPLTMTPPANYSGNFTLHVDAVVTDSATLAGGPAPDTRTFTYDTVVSVLAAGPDHAPVVASGDGDSAGATRPETDNSIEIAGTLTAADLDTTDTVTLALSGMTHTGPTGGLSDETLLSYFSVPATAVLNPGQSSAHFTWSFDSKGEAFDFLKAGETLTLHYTITPNDGHLPTGTGDGVVTITITGSEDAPVVTGTVSKPVMEDDAPSTLNALANASDADGDMLSVTNIQSTLPAGVSYDSNTHSFTLDPGDAAYQHLAAGATTTVTVSYDVSDGQTATPASVAWTVHGVNDAPGLDPIAIDFVLEDAPAADIPGATVAALFSSEYSDIDGGPIFGIVVSANNANAAQGTWQYKTPTGGIWEDIGSPDPAHALVFSADTLLRFVPAQDFSGLPGSLEVHAVDDTYDEEFTIGSDPGGGGRYTINITDQGDEPLGVGGTTPFSNPSTLAISVTPVNDAPTFTGYSLDSTSAQGANVPIVFGVIAEDVDSDNYGGGSLTAAVTGGLDTGDTLRISDTGYIKLDVDGTTVLYDSSGNVGSYVAIGTLTDNTDSLTISLFYSATDAAVARLTSAISYENDAATPSVGTRTVTFTLQDGGGTANGGDDATSFTADVTVQAAANHAPVLQDFTFTLDQGGAYAYSAVNGHYSDDDGQNFAGLAISAIDADPLTQGVWQYSDGTIPNPVPGGSPPFVPAWHDIPTDVSEAHAFTIGYSTQLRFVPVLGYAGTPSITAYALDSNLGQNSGSAFVYLDVSQHGGSEHISDPATISVPAGNHGPMLDDTFWITRASVNDVGIEGDDFSASGAVSSTGVVVFSSDADNLVDDDNNDAADIFVRSLRDGTTQRVSVASNGNEASQGSLDGPSISADGNFVAFQSNADNLVPGDNNNVGTIYLRNISASTTEMISVDSFGNQLGTESLISNHAVSDDGRYVVFETEWAISGDDNNHTWDVYVRDTELNQTILVSAYDDDDSPGATQSDYGVISGDGHFVAFNSTVDGLDGGTTDTNGHRDVFVRDLTTGATTLVSDPTDDYYADSAAYGISGDGHYVLYTAVVDGSGGGTIDLLVRDTTTGDLTFVGEANSGGFIGADISADGRYIVYSSGNDGGGSSVYVFDMQTQLTMRVSMNADGEYESTINNEFPAISADGRFVTFESNAGYLVPNDNNGVEDVFVVDLAAPARVIHDHADGSPLAAFGLVSFSDEDTNDTHTATVIPIGTGHVGTFEIDPHVMELDGHGSLHWDFQVDHASVAYLAAGDTLTQSYAVRIDDSAGGHTFQRIDVTIVGTNDAPVVDLDTGNAGIDYSAMVFTGGSAVAISAAPAVSDVDTAVLTFARVVLSAGGTAGDYFTVAGSSAMSGDLPNGIHWEITGTPGGFVPLTVTLSGEKAPSDYADAFAQVAFGTTTSTLGQVDITVTAYDGDAYNYPATAHITVAVPNDNIFTGMGVDGGSWFDAGNWSLGHVPTAGENVSFAEDSTVGAALGDDPYTIAQLDLIEDGVLHVTGTGYVPAAGGVASAFVFNGAMINRGYIDVQNANFDAFGNVTNNGEIHAIGQYGILNFGSLAGSTIDNTHGDIEINNGGQAYFINNTVIGGEIAVVDDGSLVVLRGATLEGVWLNAAGNGLGHFEIAAASGAGSSTTTFDGSSALVFIDPYASINIDQGATLNLIGTIQNAGTIIVDPLANPSYLTIDGLVTLGGGGHVVMEDPLYSVITGTGGLTGTLDNVNNTISGTGQLGGGSLNIINEAGGEIAANLSANGIVINTGLGTLTNHGLIVSNGSGGIQILGAIANDGMLQADSGLFSIGGAVTGGGTASIGGGTLQFLGAADVNVTFSNDSIGTLRLADVSEFTGTISGLSNGDTIDLVDIDPGNVSLVTNAGTGDIELHYGPGAGDFISLGNLYPTGNFALSADGGNGTNVSFQLPHVTFESEVFPGLIATGSGLPGTISGGTPTHSVIGISTDGVNFTPVTIASDGTVHGTYFDFNVDHDGRQSLLIGNAAYPDASALIDAIEANETNTTPLADTFYYEIEDQFGIHTVDSITYTLSDLRFEGTGPLALSAVHDVPLSLGDLYVFDYGAASFGQSELTVTVAVSFGELAVTGGDASVSYSGDHHSVTIVGTQNHINSELANLTYTASGPGSTAILMSGIDGPSYTASYFVGSIVTDDTAPAVAGDLAVITAVGHDVMLTVQDLDAIDPDTSPYQLTFTVVGSDHGNLTFGPNRIQLGVEATFTLADIQAGNVFYQPAGTYTGQDHIRLRLSDKVSGQQTVLVSLGATIVDAQLTVLTTAGYDFSGEHPSIIMAAGLVVPDDADPDTTFAIVDPDAGRKFVYSGSGFTYGASNVPTGGVVTAITEVDLSDNQPLARLDIHVDAAAWYSAIVAKAAGDNAPLEALAHDWTFNFLGGSGDDVLDGADFNDYFSGRAGNDTFLGHFGFDRANYGSATEGITVNLAAGTVTGPSVGTDTLDSIEMVTGTEHDDSFDARGFNATSQNTGSTVTGNVDGSFNEFEGRGGTDNILGNANTRISYYHATAGVAVTFDEATSWNTSLYPAGGATGIATGNESVGTDHFSGVNSVRGSYFDDTFQGSTNPLGTAENFEGLGGDDFIDGGGGFNRAQYNLASDGIGITVNLGDGVVLGGPDTGNDTLRSISGIYGTDYDDLYDASTFSTTSTNAGKTQTSASDATPTDFNEFEGGLGNDTVYGNNNTRIAFYHATSGVLVQLGDSPTHGAAIGSSIGHDDIASGVNRVRGSEFNDWIVGNASNNNLEGQGGNDTLRGLGGLDVLTGGTGADTFVFDAVGGLSGVNNMDTIRDFHGHASEGDHIDLRTVTEITSFSQLVLNNVSGNTEITFGSGTAKITLIGVNKNTLNASDFIIGNQVNVQVQTPDGYDFGSLYDDMAGSVLQSARDSEHMLVFNAARGVTFELVGSGFVYGVNGPTAGTINEIHILDANPADFTDLVTIHDHTLVDSDGWAIPASSLFNAVGAYASSDSGTHATGLAALNTIFNAAHYSVTGASGFVTTDIEGHSGNDALFGGDQADTFVGLSGSDTVDYSHATAAVTASLANPGSNTGAALGDLYSSIENLRGTDGADTLTGDGSNNVLEGGPGGDALTGGGGADTASYEHAAAGVLVDLGVPASNTGEAAGDSYASIQNIRGSSHDDNLFGNAIDNVIEGGAGNDSISGGGGTNTASYEHASASVTVDLAHSGAQDTGGAGSDTLIQIQNLIGSQHNDLLTGDSGGNILLGLGGSDTFVFKTQAFGGIGQDTIGDFSPGEDHIELDYEAFDANVPNDFDNWISSHASVPLGTQDTLIDFDPLGHPGQQTLLLKNVAIANLHANDFILPAGGGGQVA